MFIFSLWGLTPRVSPAPHTSFPSTSSSILLKICSIKVLLLLIWFYNLYLTVNSLRILGMLRHSACVTRQTHTSRYVLSISSNAAKRRFKDKKIYIVFYYNYINKKCNIFLHLYGVWPREFFISLFSHLHFQHIVYRIRQYRIRAKVNKCDIRIIAVHP